MPGSLHNSFQTFQGDLSHEIQRIPSQIASVDSGIGLVTGIIAYTEDRILTPIGNSLLLAADKILIFIKNNWKPLLAYVFAWGIIISCTGLMYGFQAVALKLTIGMACGLVFGIITGVFTVNVFDPSGKTTLWNLLNEVIEKLDPNGTRQIVLAVAVTVLLAASVVFPYVMGAVFGIFIGNQITTKAGTGKNLGSDPTKVKNEQELLKNQIAEMQERLIEISNKLALMDSAIEKRQLTAEIGEMRQKLEEMYRALERLYPIEIDHDHPN